MFSLFTSHSFAENIPRNDPVPEGVMYKGINEEQWKIIEKIGDPLNCRKRVYDFQHITDYHVVSPEDCKDDYQKSKNKKFIDWSRCISKYKPKYCYNKGEDGKRELKDLKNIIEISNISGIETFDATPLGEWTTYKVGIYNTIKDSGFVKVYKDDILIFDYEGITFDWKGSYYETVVRIGPYRDSDPTKEGYPPQSIHYDDFTVVSDKKTLDKYLK